VIELSIHFTADDEEAPIEVRLFRADTGTWTDPVPFEPPLDDDVLGDLRWYLELFSTWPTGPDYERAERIESQMEDWGRALLESVTPDRESAQMWRQFADANDEGKLVTIDGVDARVLRLPWELLADEGGHLFSAGIGVRRRLKKVTGSPVKPFALPVRVLIVVSRPQGAGFIDPRAVSRPLLDALDALGDRVVTEFLYPPTLKALTDRLRDRTAPPVHVVHFDGHGVYDADLGLGYLLFETEEHQADRVDANRLGTLLNKCGVPLMVLNACQSAAQEEANPYASVAARLIRAGVGSVLAMNYSVLVAAAEKFVEAFYGALAGGLSVGQAVDEGRYDLYSDVERHTVTRRDEKGDLVERKIRLVDWFLPALYQQSMDPVVFQPTEGAPPAVSRAMPRALIDPSASGGLPAPPRHGFHGRAREMLQLERALAEHPVVVVHGFGGMGKTALAAEAGRWFHRTGRFPGGAAFVSFEHGGSLAQLCSWVAQAVSGDPNYLLHAEDPVAAVGQLLRDRPALVILDNFESVIGPDPMMPTEELQAILDAVSTWVEGSPPLSGEGSRLLITTRDTTFNDPRFAPSRRCTHVALDGLATPDALELAAAVIDDHGIDRARIPRQALVDLMKHLGGHPLSLTLVLPHLREYTPDELTARFEELLPGFTQGEAVARNESLAVSLEFSLRRLGAETRAALPDLAVFQGGCMEYDLLAITEIDEDLWQGARAELEAAALVSAESVPGVNPPFLRFHPTLAPYLAPRLDGERRAELEVRYWQRYYAVADYLYRSDTQHPHQARAIAVREMPNLLHALDRAIAAGAAAEAVDFATSIARFLDNFGRWRERDALMARVAGLDVAGEAGLTKAEYLALKEEGKALLGRGLATQARQVFQDLLDRLEMEPAYDVDYDHALTLWWLGRCLAAQGRPAQAIDFHRQALAGFEALSETNEQAKEMLGKVYTDLGDNLTSLGRFDEAQEAYESGLDISRDVGDRRSVGVKLGQLGTLALLRGDLDQARRRHTEALETFRALGEPQSEAVIWHQLGMVAQEAAEQGSAGDWDEAERCYREAVRIREQIRDLPLLATTFNQLAIVAVGAGRPADAERWYLRAQELKDQVAPHDHSTLGNLANLYLSQQRLEEAEQYAHSALQLQERQGVSSEPWKTYAILAQVAEARGRVEEAARWRRKEQESYAAYAGAAHRLPGWAPQFISVVAAAVQGNQEAQQNVEGILPQLEEGGWNNLCNAVRRILGGESDFEKLRTDLDREDAYIVHTILARLSGEAAPTPPAARAAPPPQAGEGQGAAAREALAQLRQQWAPVVDAVVMVAQDGAPVPPDLAAFLDRMGASDDWRVLVAVLRRILAGERDPAALLPGLDATDTVIAADVLQGLGVDVETPPLSGTGPGEGSQQAMGLEDLFDMVAQACRPDAPPQLGEQLYALTQQLARDPRLPAEIQALGRILNRILCGEREPDLSALPPELAQAVEQLLAAIPS
jgi:tetratricopeptide (TPR) repeat protein